METLLYNHDKYEVDYGCGNCGNSFRTSFKKGEIAPPSGVECPVCKTKDTAKKF